MPRIVSDAILVTGTAGVLSISQLFNYLLQGERVDVGFPGAAQIDKFGSLNSTLIGEDWGTPVTKLPGSGAPLKSWPAPGKSSSSCADTIREPSSSSLTSALTRPPPGGGQQRRVDAHRHGDRQSHY
ncbi:CoA-transferase [Streptomyces sp. NPDC055078]